MKNQMASYVPGILLYICFAGSALAQAPDVQEPSSAEDITDVLTGGVPMGRWKRDYCLRA